MGLNNIFPYLDDLNYIVYFTLLNRGTQEVATLDIDNPTGRFARFAMPT